jgi:SAM-dependent methyltransferase
VLAFLQSRLDECGAASWLDLCCGSGQALVDAAVQLRADASRCSLSIHGIDLVSFFVSVPPACSFVNLKAASLRNWQATREYDLITCVHGLHYIGDRLGLISSAVSWLARDGLLLAHLDADNIRLAGTRPAGKQVIHDLRAAGLSYAARWKLLRCSGRRVLTLPYEYIGADDQAGPNWTGQPAVNSYYAASSGPAAATLPRLAR